jgi:hypothetical protein
MLTLFAGLVLNFSKIFWDWVLEARAAMVADIRRVVRCGFEVRRRVEGCSPFRDVAVEFIVQAAGQIALEFGRLPLSRKRTSTV